MRSLTTALTTIRRSPYQSLTAILMVAITFFVAHSVLLFALGAQQVLTYFESQPQIIAFFEVDAPATAITEAQELMQTKPYVKEVVIVSKEEALALYQETNRDQPLLLELVTADILPASIEVAATNIEALALIRTDLEGIEAISEIDFQENVIEQLRQWTTTIRTIGIGAVGVLGVISFLIITITIALKAATQKMAISIMRLIGATSGYIRGPFVWEGMVYGSIGSLIGWAGSYAGLLYATPWIQAFLGEIALFPIPAEFFAAQAGAGAIGGLLLGGFAGFVAVSRLIRN